MSDDAPRELAAHLASAWLARPKGDFVLVILRLVDDNAPRTLSIRRTLRRVVEVPGVRRGEVNAFFDARLTELAAAILAASTCGVNPPAILFSIDTAAEGAALN